MFQKPIARCHWSSPLCCDYDDSHRSMLDNQYLTPSVKIKKAMTIDESECVYESLIRAMDDHFEFCSSSYLDVN